MASLTAAHRGYEYQDLLVACRLVDVLLGSVVQVHVDEKLTEDDRFDDLSTIDVDGRRERTQFKHTENADRPLSLATFTTEARGLRLDRVITSILADRGGPGQHAKSFSYRILFRDIAPVDPALTAVLRPIEQDDPGGFVPGVGTRRFRFDAAALWSQWNGSTPGGTDGPFRFLAGGTLNLLDLEWVCHHLVVEVGAPPASADLTAPSAAEHLLLNRVRAEVGADAFPNADRSAVDVAAAMVSTSRAARQRRLVVTAEELLRRAQLRSDFGAVSRAHPVDHELEVLRPSTVDEIVDVATDISARGGCLLVVGPPGHGKSWISQQVLNRLSDGGWLTAEHYCYLGDADGERNERVLAEAVFGSLVGRLAAADPTLLVQHRPRFAADEEALEGCVRRSLAKDPNRRVALVVDGVDHITRVRARAGDRFDPSKSLSESLAALDLPAGSVLILLSQPGSHLQPLEQVGAKTVAVPGLSRGEIELLAVRLNVLPGAPATSPVARPLVEDGEGVARFLDALEERTTGNALYATYLCRETLRRADTLVDPAATVRSLPLFDGTLKSNYEHLYRGLGAEAGWVADVIALVNVAVTRAELRQIRPDAAHRVDAALAVLAPVLVERATQGGVRVYHESFARYLRSTFDADAPALTALLERIADWLQQKGLYADPRAFRSLLPTLAEAGNNRRVLELVGQDFVIRAVAAGFPSSAIVGNLAIAVRAAAALEQWAVVVRCVELARAADSYQSERFDSTLVAFADVPAAILGADTLAARLLDDDRLVMPARAGLQMCAAVDRLGATAPWRAYMAGHLRESKTDNTAYGEASDQAVKLAWMRGRLRLASSGDRSDSEESPAPNEIENEANRAEADEPEAQWDPAAPIDWNRLAAWVEQDSLPIGDVVTAIADTHGADAIIRLIGSLDRPAEACLAFAELLASGTISGESHWVSPRQWAIAALAHGIPSGSVHRVLRLGVDPAALAQEPSEAARDRLLDLTRRVQERSVRFENDDLATWLDACSLAARLDEPATRLAEILIVGEGWYRCWLRFVIALSRAESAHTGRGALAIDALGLLAGDVRPFAGDPRACDLYSLHGTIRDTITRAMQLLDDADWENGIRLLNRVSDSITTTLSGELGGPLPPDFVMRLAVDGATHTRNGIAESLIAQEIATGSARRYYSDLAEYRLIAARLALNAKKPEQAEVLWREACAFLTAYGFHKDITIYELLDPLPSLIKADPARGRRRVAAVQGLCERIPWHTDRRETRGAWSRWWELLAKADPVAAIRLAVPALLGRCNDPNWLLDEALEDVWEEWHEHVDPLISGALRLTLGKSLDKRDRTQIQRLADDMGCDRETARQLMTWLLARADERPVAYSYSNSAELLAKDDDVLSDLNSIAASADVPTVSSVREESASPVSSETPSGISSAAQPAASVVDALAYSTLPAGLPGLTRAIRAWRRRPYDTRSPEWAVERFANAIGYRLIELAADGRHHEATSILRSLGESAGFGERSGILRSVAEGLERHGKNRLAAVAYAMAWTRTRGHGGWLTFGGEAELDALERASGLDAGIARSVVAEEIERAVATSYGPYGISQAVVFAFAAGALRVTTRTSIDIAFDVWDEACAVIGARAPRVHDHDDPDQPYLPPDPDTGEAAPGDLLGAFALAVLGGLFHPSRERKRRALLAAQLLLDQRSDTAANAFSDALSKISDPATLTWLLRLIEFSREKGEAVVVACQPVLRELASRGFLTVRALARRSVRGEELPLVPSAPPEPELLADDDNPTIWTPDGETAAESDESDGLDAFLNDVAGRRLRRGEHLLPRLRNAVQRRVASSVEQEQIKQRLNSQLDDLASRARKRWPDAFLVHEETIEGTLQSVAAGGRAAMLGTGKLITNAVEWEDKMASALLDDPEIPLILEATRQPRPPISAPPGNGHPIWARVRDGAAGGENLGIEEAAEEDGVFTATLGVQPYTAAAIVDYGTFRSWRWLATMEQRWIKSSDWKEEEDLFAKRYCVMEVRDVGDRQALGLPPVAAGDLRMWKAELHPVLATSAFAKGQPVVGVDRELRLVGDGRHGLCSPTAVLVPTAALIASLGLHPADGCTYADRDGAGLALVTWRAEYDTSEYELARPRIRGSGIVIRQDLLDRLATAAGEQRLVLRSFVVGAAELAGKAS
jgi:hypothetical protein